MAGTATTVFEETRPWDLYAATKLLEVNFTGVVGNAGPGLTRAVVSAATPMPKGVLCLGLYYRVTNAIGGPAGDDIYGVIELLMPPFGANNWTQSIAGVEIPFNTDGSAVNVGAGMTYATPRSHHVISPTLSTELLLATAGGSWPMHIASQVRIGFNVNHVGAASGSANLTAELWSLPLTR